MSPTKSGSKTSLRRSTGASSRSGSNSGRGNGRGTKSASTQGRSTTKSTSRSGNSKGTSMTSRSSSSSRTNRNRSQTPEWSTSGRSSSTRQQRGNQFGGSHQQIHEGPYGNYTRGTGYGSYSDNRYESNRYDDRNRNQGNQYQQYGYDDRYQTYGQDQNYRSQSGNRGGSKPYGQYQHQNYNQSYPSGKREEGLRKLLIDQLKDMYWAEKALTKALPKMIKKTSSEELINAIEDHLQVTEGQVSKLEEVFQILGIKASAKKCEAMEGLIKEAEDITGELEKGPVRDAGIICAAQKVEHYEIATYGSLATYAQTLDEQEAADLLHEILEEEKEADEKLTEVAGTINWEAMEEGEEEEEDDDDENEEEDDEEDEEEDEDEDELSTIESTNVSSKTPSKKTPSKSTTKTTRK